jgi:hypothetical protein
MANASIHKYSLESKSLERKTNPLVKLLNESNCNMANASIHKYSLESKSLERKTNPLVFLMTNSLQFDTFERLTKG